MTPPKRVLMTGANGYIGSVMAPHFLQAGYEVVGLDTGYFHECTFVPDAPHVGIIRKDLRDLQPDDLATYEAVVHLGALSNDPIGNLQPRWTEEINFQASVRLAQLAKAAGIRRFLFSSSCIMYGMSATAVVTEDSPLDPKTEYARSKVKAEHAISALADATFSPTFLRNGTVYGVSPRMRFDTVLNNLMGSAMTTGKVVLHSDGTPWRPVVHVRDVARAFMAALEAPRGRRAQPGVQHWCKLFESSNYRAGGDRGQDRAQLRASSAGDAGRRPTHLQGRLREVRAGVSALRVHMDGAHGCRGPVRRAEARLRWRTTPFLDRRFTRLDMAAPSLRLPIAWMTHCAGRRHARGLTMIDGVKIVPLRQIVDERGKIMHMLKTTDPHFVSFGEIYFSCAWPGTVKAWHIHQSMTSITPSLSAARNW